MNLQEQSFHNCVTPFSTTTIESLHQRKPRFNRQKSSNKCECKSASKNKSSCDSFSLSKFYVKKSFLKPSTPEKNLSTERNHYNEGNSSVEVTKINKYNLESTRIQNKNDSQLLKKSQIHIFDEKQNQIQGFRINGDGSDETKNQIQSLLKKTIFYREKCEKYEKSIKQVKIEKSKLETEVKMFSQQNQKFKLEIKQLKTIIDNYIGNDIEASTPTKKFVNKNLAKLKQQYHNFRQEQESSKKSLENRYLETNSQLQQAKQQNDKLRQDLIRNNELYNLKLKMMQEKEIFLEKNLSFTKNALNQLQKDYEEKKGQILESKRLSEIIKDKNKQMESLKSKYQNIVKILNGEKKRGQTNRIQKDQSQKISIPTGFKSRHSLQIKSIIYNHKQNGQLNSTIIKANLQQKARPSSSCAQSKIHNKTFISKENCQVLELNKTTKPSTSFLAESSQLPKWRRNMHQGHILKESSSDLTIFSSNSLQLTPQK